MHACMRTRETGKLLSYLATNSATLVLTNSGTAAIHTLRMHAWECACLCARLYVRIFRCMQICVYACICVHVCMYACVTKVLSITRPLPLDHSFPPPLTYTLPLSHALSMPVSAGGRVCRCQDPDTPCTCSFAVRARKFPCPLHIDCVRNVCVCVCVCVCVPARFTEPPSHARTLKRTLGCM